MREQVRCSRCGVYGYGIFDAAEVYEMRECADKAGEFAWEVDGRGVSEDLGGDRERKSI